MTLCEASLFQTYLISSLRHSHDMNRRLMDLGFVEGSQVTPILDSPSRGMKAFIIKGCKIALRNSDSKNIVIREMGDMRVF